MIGMFCVGVCARISRQACKPSFSGIIMSSRMMSGKNWLAFSTRLLSVHRLNHLVLRGQLRFQKAQHVRLVVGHQQRGASAIAGELDRFDGLLQRGQCREQFRAPVQIRQPFLRGYGPAGFRLVGNLFARFGLLLFSHHFGLFIRQPHGERGALAFLAFHGDLAVLDFDQFLHERQSDADALIFALGRTVGLPEAVEDERQIFLGDAHAGVAHNQNEFFTLLFGAQGHVPAGGRELERVEHEVQHDFLQLVAIGQHRAQRRIHKRFELDALVVGHLPRRAGEAFGEFRDFERLMLDFHAAGFEADEVEQIVDEFEQPHAIGVHGGEQIARVLVEARG